MSGWIEAFIIWYLRRQNGDFSMRSKPYKSKYDGKRRYHIVLMDTFHYHQLKMDTTWTRGGDL